MYWRFLWIALTVIGTAGNTSYVVEKTLTNIDWAHAVNDKDCLHSALDSNAAMLEADVILGHVKSSEDGPEIPIMAHPPARTSDLSLTELLTAVNESNKKLKRKKGIKLDFKSIEAFEASQEAVASISKTKEFPLWLNADILPGPIDATATPVDPKRFLTLCSTQTKAVLSIGWTTRWIEHANKGYTIKHVEEIIGLLTEMSVVQIVTFPVRASLAAYSKNVLLKLLNETRHLKSTLTVWDSTNDAVDVEKLRELILSVGLDKTYLDVRQDLADKLHLPDET